MRPVPLTVVLAEDSPIDAELTVAELRRAGFDPKWKRVEHEAEFLAAIKELPDIILSDFSMPHFSGLRAAELLRASGLNIPFILISGTVGEDVAVQAMKHGATDYLLKDRIARLGSAVQRALEEKRLRTDREQAEKSLALFRVLIDRSTDGIEVIDPQTGRFLDINETTCQRLGYGRNEMLSLTVMDIDTIVVNKSNWAQHVEGIRQAGSKTLEGRHMRKDGSTFPVELNVRYVRLDRDYLIAVVRDITERRRAEQALRDSEEQFRQLAENITEVFWITEPGTRGIIYVSPAYATIWDRPCTSLYESPLSWNDAIHPEDQPRIQDAFAALERSREYNETYRILRPDGTIRWIQDHAFPLRTPAGNVYRVVGTARDITDNRLLEEQYRQSQKMEAIGALASGIAHDFNNILGIIMMQIGLLREERDASLIPEHAEEIERAAQRAANLTRQLLLFSRRQVAQTRDVNLNELANNISKMLHRTLGENIRLQLNYAPVAPIVHADQGMLEQVLLNLTVNARDAMPNGGRLIIGVSIVEFDALSAMQSQHARAGNFACIAVTDTGTGIPPEIKARIFEPFFTTKEVGKGTGLGLATVFGIVQQHHGWVDVHSDVGLGTIFRIYLPLSTATKADEINDISGRTIPGGNETILIVEDEPQLRALVKQSLTRLGYTVLEAAFGKQALVVWQNHKRHVHLVITDMVMPEGMTGRELGEILLGDRPDIKIIYTSGYSSDLFTKDFEMREGDNFITKPFQVQKLAETVRFRLDSKG